MKTKQFYIKKLRLLYCILSHQYPESAGNHINTNYITWKLLKAKENHWWFQRRLWFQLRSSACNLQRLPQVQIPCLCQHIFNIYQQIFSRNSGIWGIATTASPLTGTKHIIRTIIVRSPATKAVHVSQNASIEKKIPSQMDVALWCYKWDGLVHWVGWGKITLGC